MNFLLVITFILKGKFYSSWQARKHFINPLFSQNVIKSLVTNEKVTKKISKYLKENNKCLFFDVIVSSTPTLTSVLDVGDAEWVLHIDAMLANAPSRYSRVSCHRC